MQTSPPATSPTKTPDALGAALESKRGPARHPFLLQKVLSVSTTIDASFDSLSPLQQCVDVSRRLGSDPTLVLHGGGNTSIKEIITDLTGESLEVVHVKGSGWDLGTIEEAGFAPLRRQRLLELAQLEELDDTRLVNELKQASLHANAPTGSIEAVLHGLLPARVVLHTHADAIVALGDQPNGAQIVREVLGERLLVVDYVKPGFDLAKAVANAWAGRESDVDAIVLLKHGLFTFSDSALEAYARHLDLVRAAATHTGLPLPGENAEVTPPAPDAVDPIAYAQLRSEVSAAAGAPMVLHRRPSAAVSSLLTAPNSHDISTRGTITPEHVIRTKRLPMLGRDVAAYTREYEEYVERNRARAEAPLAEIDPAPRVILDPELGLVTAGRTVKESLVSADIYEHTALVIQAAERVGSYDPVSEAEAFDIEYWELEQAKLRAVGASPAFAGEIALVTGAASGIGKACAQALMAAGAAVVALDLSPHVTEVSADPRWFGVVCDVTDPEAVRRAVRAGVERFGSLDIVVPAAGIFAASAPIQELERNAWDLSMAVNVDGLFSLLQEVQPYLALAPKGGRVVLIASKNVPAPGPGAAAYSASKAAATQLARVAALEWAGSGVRVNMVNPDAVFDTGLWTPALLAERAKKYGMSIDEYKRRNLLRTEVTSAQVASVVTDLCRDQYSATTGAQVPVDGGSDRIV
jgi:rhamnose utilization protein RhaD (predicted bifunctional aldolase and dehydrogenase)/NAD(P)-dependent dehydrogenase (short-subunit alcohol dehydrogenase family)